MRALALAITLALFSLQALAVEGTWQTERDYSRASGIASCYFYIDKDKFVFAHNYFQSQDTWLTAMAVSNKRRLDRPLFIAIDDKRFFTQDEHLSDTDLEGYSDNAPGMLSALVTGKALDYEWTEGLTGNTVSGQVSLDGLAELIADCQAWVKTL